VDDDSKTKIDELTKRVDILETFVFAKIDCLHETPGFNSQKFRVLRREYADRGLELVTEQSRAARSELLKRLAEFDGPKQ
jgi:hypothetical protein